MRTSLWKRRTPASDVKRMRGRASPYMGAGADPAICAGARITDALMGCNGAQNVATCAAHGGSNAHIAIVARFAFRPQGQDRRGDARPERAHRSRRRRHQRSRRLAAAAKSARQDTVADRRGRRSDFRQPRHPRISRLARGRGRALSQRSGGAVQGSDASGACRRDHRRRGPAGLRAALSRAGDAFGQVARSSGRQGDAGARGAGTERRPRLRRAMSARSPWPAPSAISICASRGRGAPPILASWLGSRLLQRRFPPSRRRAFAA